MKIRDIVILREALDDLNNGRLFYEHIQENIGGYFWDSLVSDIESLIIYAGVHTKIDDLYRMLSRRFPYAIYYQVEGEIVRVIAILPMRRDPVWIKKQLGHRIP
jgi:hypothetical protein